MNSSWGAVNAQFNSGASEQSIQEIVEQISTTLSKQLSFYQINNLDDLIPAAQRETSNALSMRRMQSNLKQGQEKEIVHQVIGRVSGLSFLIPLFSRGDLSEITINSDGKVWLLKKGQQDGDYAFRADPVKVTKIVESFLQQSGRALNEASPNSVCKLRRVENPEFPALRGGARVHILHPSILTSRVQTVYNSVSIRLYEPDPVTVEKMLAWKIAPEPVLNELLRLVGEEARILIIGGTYSGKTTILSGLCNGGIPQKARIVKIEDPEEIWLSEEDHPNVVTIEPRPAQPGTSVLPYTLADGVDDAMRMSPRWLIMGEVRRGDAALALFRAQMSDHPGLSTFHADSPEAAAGRIAVLISSETSNVSQTDANYIFALAVDIVIQTGWLVRGQRRGIMGVWAVQKYLSPDGKVVFEQLYKPGDTEMKKWKLAPEIAIAQTIPVAQEVLA